MISQIQQTKANTFIVATNDPGETMRELEPLGFRWEILFNGKYYLKYAQGKLWALQCFRRQVGKQEELL